MGGASTNEEPVLSPRGEFKPPMAFEGDEPSIIIAEDSPTMNSRKRAYSNNQGPAGSRSMQ